MAPKIKVCRRPRRYCEDALSLGSGSIRNLLLAVGLGLASLGCAHQKQAVAPPSRDLLVVVTPVINLSGDMHLDTLRVTDLVASELMAYRHVQVVPVNLTVAALARHGRTRVEAPEDALLIARELGADAAIVVAVTEWDPYDPPVLGLVMQWYAPAPVTHEYLDPTAVSRQASDVSLSQPETAERATGNARTAEAVAPRIDRAAGPEMALRPIKQVQRVFNASHRKVQDEVCEYGSKRDGAVSPYDWRRYVKSQELFIRYCSWALIRTILEQVSHEGAVRTASENGP